MLRHKNHEGGRFENKGEKARAIILTIAAVVAGKAAGGAKAPASKTWTVDPAMQAADKASGVLMANTLRIQQPRI